MFDLRWSGRAFSINRTLPPSFGGDSYQGEKEISTKEKKSFLRRRRMTSMWKALPQTKLSLSKRKAFKIKTFSFNEKELKQLKILGEENKYTNMPLILKHQTFKSRPSLLTRRKRPRISAQIVPSTPKTELSQRSRLLSLKPTPQDGDWIRGYYICSL